MFDSGSQKTYISERVKNILGLPSEGTEKLALSTFGNTKTSQKFSSRVNLSIVSNTGVIPIHALTLPFLCLPIRNQAVDIAKKQFDNLQFADSGGDTEIDLLVGCDYYWQIMTGKVQFGTDDGVVAMETKIGWVLSGPCKVNTTTANHVTTHAMRVAAVTDPLETTLKTFWDFESIGIHDTEKSPWEDSFSAKITRNDENRCETELPFKQNSPILPDNYELSKKRLLNLRERLQQRPELLKTYNDVFEEQKRMNIIETAPEESTIGETHYLPHHCVIRNDKSTTKCRVVFDASAKVPGGTSLNDCLYKGPNLTPLLYDILLYRFRTKAIALIADIAKAFLMVSIAESDRDYLRFLWFDDVFADQPTITRNRFARMVFGVTSSPAGLNATIRKHADNYLFDEKFVQQIYESFYVDDYIGGTDNLEQAVELYKKLKLRFLEAHFYLRKEDSLIKQKNYQTFQLIPATITSAVENRKY